MSFNIGNVSAVIKSPNPPVDDNGVEKRYCLWAKPVGPTDEDGYALSGEYTLYYWNNNEWTMLSPLIVPSGRFTIYKHTANSQSIIETGDVIAGMWTDANFFRGQYLGDINGGGIGNKENYNIIQDDEW
jgi:hypothetical protein